MQKKPMRKKTFKMKMEKRLNVTLRQGYVCKVAEMLNKGMIPTNNGDILREETYVPKVLYSEGSMFRTFVKMLGT